MGSCINLPAQRKAKRRRRRRDVTGAKVIALRPRPRDADNREQRRSAAETLRALLRWLKPTKPATALPHRLAK